MSVSIVFIFTCLKGIHADRERSSNDLFPQKTEKQNWRRLNHYHVKQGICHWLTLVDQAFVCGVLTFNPWLWSQASIPGWLSAFHLPDIGTLGTSITSWSAVQHLLDQESLCWPSQNPSPVVRGGCEARRDSGQFECPGECHRHSVEWSEWKKEWAKVWPLWNTAGHITIENIKVGRVTGWIELLTHLLTIN